MMLSTQLQEDVPLVCLPELEVRLIEERSLFELDC